MPTIEVWKNEQRFGTCQGCGAKLTWAKTVKSNRWMPLTGRPMVMSTHATHDGREIQVIDSKDSHFATCPDADKFHRRTKKGSD